MDQLKMGIQLKLKKEVYRHLSRKMQTHLWQNICHQKGRSLLQILAEQSRTKLWFFKLVCFELSLHCKGCKATVGNTPQALYCSAVQPFHNCSTYRETL